MTKIGMRGTILLVLLSMGFISNAQDRKDTTDLGEFVGVVGFTTMGRNYTVGLSFDF